MAIRTDWHEDAVKDDSPGIDPFAMPSSVAVVATPTLGIDMSIEQLQERVRALVQREKKLFDMGIDCPIKWNASATCLACPFNESHDADSLKGMLCKVGCEQERAETTLIAKRDRGC